MVALVLGVALSFGQCLSVGPVNAEALRRGLRGGFRAALAVELGSCVGDGLWAALAWQMGVRLPSRTQVWIQRGVALLLAALACVSAYSLWRRYAGTAGG